jgi:hypothetical protein
LPLYYLADATVTLVRRLINREAVTQAHRSHFYQRALDGGIGIYRIIGSVFCVNIVLLGLAAATILTPSLPLHYAAIVTGCLLVGVLLWRFDRA